jgi:hypothetical protein
MTTKIDDGGSVYPIPALYAPDGLGLREGTPGLSLRDYFAGQALAGRLASETPGSFYALLPAAYWAYQMADDMIAARKGGV